MLPLHWKSCFDRNTPHITEFATVAKSLPHSLRKAHKSLISNIFLFQYRFFLQNNAAFSETDKPTLQIALSCLFKGS